MSTSHGPLIQDLHQLPPETIEEVARLHMAVMKTLLTQLGEKIVLRYYQVAKDDPDIVGFVALNEMGRVTGWAIGSPNPGSFNARVRRSVPWFSLRLALRALAHPLLAWHLLGLALADGKHTALAPNEIEFMYLGVSPDSQSKGVGRSLMQAFLLAAHKRGFHRVQLSVVQDNHPALSLHTSHGFVITHTFKEGAYLRHRMSCEIASAEPPFAVEKYEAR